MITQAQFNDLVKKMFPKDYEVINRPISKQTMKYGNIAEIERILLFLKKRNTEPSLINKFIPGFFRSAKFFISVYNEIEIIEQKSSRRIIDFCEPVWQKANAEDLRKTYEILGENFYELAINNNWTLARIRASELKPISKIMGMSFEEIIKNCAPVLAQSKEKLLGIKRLLGKNFEKAVKKCPSILTRNSIEEMSRIKGILGNSFNALIDDKPSLLVNANSRVLNKLIGLLEKENVKFDPIYHLKKHKYALRNLDNIFSDYSGPESVRDFKYWLRLTKNWNKEMGIVEIKDICERKNISVESFFKDILSVFNYQKDRKYWIGDSIPMTEQQIKENQKFVDEISNFIVFTLMKEKKMLRSLNKSDYKSEAVSLIYSRCGGHFINYHTHDSLRATIFSYIKKHLEHSHELKKLIKNNLELVMNIAPAIPSGEAEHDAWGIWLNNDANVLAKEVFEFMKENVSKSNDIMSDVMDKFGLDEQEMDEVLRDIRKTIMTDRKKMQKGISLRINGRNL